jgi:hypothetical protein
MHESTIATVVAFPRPWPPAEETRVISHSDGEFSFDLRADSTGCLLLSIDIPGQAAATYKFQRLRIEGSGRAILMIMWSPGRARLRLNGREVALKVDSPDGTFVLADSGEPAEHRSVLPNLDLNAAQTRAEYIFLATLMDINAKLSEGTRYDLIRAAGLLRQLLLDPTPLMHKVNRTYRRKIRFEVLDTRVEPPGSPSLAWQNPDPSLWPGARTITVDLDGFLRIPILTTQGARATVRDLIRTCANVKGGVHLGKVNTPEEGTLIDWDRAIRLLGEEPSLRAISGVCRVVLRALHPLTQDIVGST